MAMQNDFAKRLSLIMNIRGKKQSDISRELNIPRSGICQYLKGKGNPTTDRIIRLASYFKVNPDWLLGKVDDDFMEAVVHEVAVTNIIPFETKKIPLLGDIACGEPIICNQEYDLYINVAANLNADFCVRAKGDSMINARIFDGDLVICKKQPTVENGEIAVVIIDNEATLKRFYKHENSIELRPENPLHKPINFSDAEQESVRILGKAVAFQSLVR